MSRFSSLGNLLRMQILTECAACPLPLPVEKNMIGTKHNRVELKDLRVLETAERCRQRQAFTCASYALGQMSEIQEIACLLPAPQLPLELHPIKHAEAKTGDILVYWSGGNQVVHYGKLVRTDLVDSKFGLGDAYRTAIDVPAHFFGADSWSLYRPKT
jgi:hypothetical protein